MRYPAPLSYAVRGDTRNATRSVASAGWAGWPIGMLLRLAYCLAWLPPGLLGSWKACLRNDLLRLQVFELVAERRKAVEVHVVEAEAAQLVHVEERIGLYVEDKIAKAPLR